jgi:PAS domain S-box-containing protein
MSKAAAKIGPESARFSYKTSEGLVVMDANGLVLFANPIAKELLGYSEEGLEGKYCFEACAGHDLSGNRYCMSNCAVIEMARRNELVQNFDIQLVNRKGRKIWLNVTTLLQTEPSFGSKSHIVHIFRETMTPAGMGNYLRQSVSDYVEASLGHPEILPLHQKGDRLASVSKQYLLSPRESEVFRYLTQGCATREIARILGLSPTTVRTHVQRILKKLNVHSMLEAVARALGEKRPGPTS